MSYQVLARKWRPNNFSEVVGQEHVVRALSNALDGNKVHQAYLFSGTRGVGKTTLGRILTKCLNCEAGLKSMPCDKCQTCEGIGSGNFMDFQEVDAASRRGVEETQQLLETVMHMPGSSRYKVYLIDEVHMLSKHSFNALLKTLEEPPPHVVFILATTEPENVPATVLSRCLQFHLKNLTPVQLSKRLEHVLLEEKIKFDPESIDQIAKAGRGSLRDCLTITDQAIAFCNGDLVGSSVSEMLGTLSHDHVYELLDCIIEERAVDLVEKLKLISTLSIDYQKLIDLILEALQQMVIAKISPEASLNMDLSGESIASLAEKLNEEDIQVLYQIGLLAKRDIDLAPTISEGFEMALLRMMSFLPKTIDIKEDKKKEEKKKLEPTESEKKAKPKALHGNKVSSSKSKNKEPSSFLLDESSWTQVFKNLSLDSATKQLISHCTFSRQEQEVIYFSIPKEKLDLLNGTHRERFEDSLSKEIGSQISVFFEEGDYKDFSPNKIKEGEKLKDLEVAKESIQNEEVVKELLSNVGGELVESSISPKKLK